MNRRSSIASIFLVVGSWSFAQEASQEENEPTLAQTRSALFQHLAEYELQSVNDVADMEIDHWNFRPDSGRARALVELIEDVVEDPSLKSLLNQDDTSYLLSAPNLGIRIELLHYDEVGLVHLYPGSYVAEIGVSSYSYDHYEEHTARYSESFLNRFPEHAGNYERIHASLREKSDLEVEMREFFWVYRSFGEIQDYHEGEYRTLKAKVEEVKERMRPVFDFVDLDRELLDHIDRHFGHMHPASSQLTVDDHAYLSEHDLWDSWRRYCGLKGSLGPCSFLRALQQEEDKRRMEDKK